MATRIQCPCIEHGFRMAKQCRVVARTPAKSNDCRNVDDIYHRDAGLPTKMSIKTVHRIFGLCRQKPNSERRGCGDDRTEIERTHYTNHYDLADVDDGDTIEFQGSSHERMMHIISRGLVCFSISVRLKHLQRLQSWPMGSVFVSAKSDPAASRQGPFNCPPTWNSQSASVCPQRLGR